MKHGRWKVTLDAYALLGAVVSTYKLILNSITLLNASDFYTLKMAMPKQLQLVVGISRNLLTRHKPVDCVGIHLGIIPD